MNMFSKLRKPVEIPATMGTRESPAKIVVLKSPITSPLFAFTLAAPEHNLQLQARALLQGLRIQEKGT